MLGWFKKKLGKKPAVVEETTPELKDAEKPVLEENIQTQEVPALDTLSPLDEQQTEVTIQPPEELIVDTSEKEITVPDIKTALPDEIISEPAEVVSEPEEVPLEAEQIVSDSKEVTPELEPEVIVPEEVSDPITAKADLEKETPAKEIDVQETVVQDLKVVKESEVREKKEKKKTLFSRLTERLGKTRETFTYQLDALFLGKKEIDTDLIDDLEEILITADLGVNTTQDLIDYTRRKVNRKELADPESLKQALKKQIKELIASNEQDATLVMPDEGPFVIMVIGVNGVGKTTTIGKIAHKFQKAGNSVLLVAGDTFRAAAVSQLKIWGERNKVEVISHKEGADPSSVVFDALGIALDKNVDVVLVDTAGRMHTKDNLMEELKKIKRVMAKKLKGAPHEIMLVIDATTGQNGISQARLFDDAVGVTGMTLTKLDGTSKGGIVANISKELKIPIRFIGIGEQLDDLRDFDAEEFVDAMFHSGSSIH